MLEDLFLVGISQGLVLTLVTYGVMIPFRILNLPDLSSEGTYPFAGAICAILILTNINPIAASFIASILAGICGIGTALIYLRFKINSLLAGIILSTMLYSISLRIMGKPNIALFNHQMFISDNNIIILSSIIILLIIMFRIFLYTEAGLKLRAIGLNTDFCKKQKISITKYTILGLFIANFCNGLAGSLMIQIQHYMDIGMGIGILIHALAALMIGEKIIGNTSLNQQLTAPLVGSLIYQQIQGLALFMGLAPSDLKFLTGIIILTIIGINRKN